MIGASKILTVSYGTFSCTLEGFDEPFNTMKAIAEYFRDLAAEDRYFGAEPPTPDAAMLHRIAEREIQRRVEAKIQDNGVILRAEEARSPGVMPRAAPAPAIAALAAPQVQAEGVAAPAEMDDALAGPGTYAENQTAPVVEAPIVEAPVGEAPLLAVPSQAGTSQAGTAQAGTAQAGTSQAGTAQAGTAQAGTAQTTPSLADSIPEGVAAKLARIRQSVVAQPATPRDPLPMAVANHAAPKAAPEHFEDEHAADTATAGMPDFIDSDPESGLLTDASYTATAEAEAELLADTDLADDDLALLGAAAPGGLPPLDAVADEFAAPDTIQPDTIQPDDALLDDTMLDAIAASLNEAPEAASAEARPAPQDFDDADMANLLATLQGDAGQDSLPEAAPVPTPAPAPAIDADPVADLFADDADMEFTDDDFRIAPSTAETDADKDTDVQAPADTLADGSDLAEAPVAGLSEAASLIASAPQPAPEPTAVSEKAQRARARVIKIRRADIAPAPVVDLSPEAEAALQAELAAAGLPAAPVAIPVATSVAAADAPRKLDPAGGDAAVSRLLRQADTEMADGENRRRLSAIAHLKAAVAATVAERRLNQTPAPTEEQRADPYREDLARAVRPQRPRAPDAPRLAADRPASDRPAPLVLVSEQRIDRQPAEATPEPAMAQALPGANLVVRPRRITGGAATLQTEMRTLTAERPTPLLQDHDDEDDEDTDNIFSDARGFAEFAERLGATRLPDLMEAAAAYVACVEKREHFSRPQLMRRIGALGAPGALSREDGLISFGTLLRNGRFAKVRRGQYMLAEDSDYLAEARRIAN